MQAAAPTSSPLPIATPRAGLYARSAALILAAAALMLWASAPVALLAGILFALFIGHPFPHWNQSATKGLLQLSVVLLGFGMNLPAVLRLGVDGAGFAAITIGATLLLGRWLGRRLALDAKTSLLVASGTAICGGSAIAAVSAVIGASAAEIAVSIGTIFLLNAAALYVFPLVGHLLHLSQAQFGLWAGVAIHDISSVVGAGLSYGDEALRTAVAVKLSRTLWIVPLTLALALRSVRPPSATRSKLTIPWFIGCFLLASLLSSYVPAISTFAPSATALAHRGMILVLFLIGTALSASALRATGWRPLAHGLILWLFISTGSLLAVLAL